MGDGVGNGLPAGQVRRGRIVGSLNESIVYASIVKDPSIRSRPAREIMGKPFRYVDIETPVRLLAGMITAGRVAGSAPTGRTS